MKGVKILRDQRSNKKERLPAQLQRWQLRVSTGEVNPADGKRERKFRTFRGTEAQAEAALRAFISELENGLQLDSKLTVAQFADEWLAEKERDKLAGRTLIRYEIIIRCYIKPTLGCVVLAELSLADVKRALHEWRTTPRKDRKKDVLESESTIPRKGRKKDVPTTSESTIHHVFTTLSNLCESAVIERTIKENPCRFLKRSQRPRRTTPEIVAADADTSLTMLDALRETEVGPITELASYSGLRLGEALGLPWGNIDLDSEVLFVKQVCEQRSDRTGKRFARIRAYPKTRSSVRPVELPPQAIALLRRCKADYNARLLAVGLAASPKHLVFPNPNLGATRCGQAWDPTMPWAPDEFSSAYRWRVTRTGLPYMSFKALTRATYSTLHADIGTPVQVIQRLLGHSSTTTTLKHYVRILDKAKSQAAQRFGEALEAARRRRLS